MLAQKSQPGEEKHHVFTNKQMKRTWYQNLTKLKLAQHPKCLDHGSGTSCEKFTREKNVYLPK